MCLDKNKLYKKVLANLKKAQLFWNNHNKFYKMLKLHELLINNMFRPKKEITI